MNNMETKHHIHYAYNESGDLINIEQAEKGGRYFCIHCHQEMIVKKGEMREHHFSHKKDNPNCCWESFLHALAKLKIYEWLNETKSIKLYILSRCEKNDSCPMFGAYHCKGERKVFDLKQLFQVAGVEKSFGGFIADILLEKRTDKTKDPVFVEIFVTHGCSYGKYNSGYRIIEFKIDSEKDIENIVSSQHICESEKVAFYNFKNPISNNVKQELARYTIFNSGKAHFDTAFCTEIESTKKGICQIYFPIHMADYPDMYQWALVTAHEKGVNFKSCNLCKFSVYNDRYGERVCKLYKIRHGQFRCNDNNPNECKEYNVGNYGRINNALSASIPSVPFVLKDYTKKEIYYHSGLNSEDVTQKCVEIEYLNDIMNLFD